MHPELSTAAASPLHLLECGYPQAFITEIDAAVQAARAGNPRCIVLLAIDNLPMMISGHGYANAEHVMQELPALLMPLLPEGSIITRVQRDQFALLLPIDDAEEIETVIIRTDNTVRYADHTTSVGKLYAIPKFASLTLHAESTTDDAIGRIIARLTDASADSVLDNDFAADMGEQNRKHMEAANLLTQAMQEQRFRLAFQPIISSKTGQVVHYEALLRLLSRDGKISSAGALIPIAERMGMVHLLDEIALEMVVKELRYDPDVIMAFNVSNETTRSPSWMRKFQDYLRETPEIGPRMICEITETAAHRDLKQAAMFCADIQAYGVEIALDDFGSGYTSFRQLKALSVDMVKIDGAFVKDLTDNADNRFFVKTLLDFTSGFGLKSVAEFVENGETAKMLIELGVDYLQGYYFGKPSNVRLWLNKGQYARE